MEARNYIALAIPFFFLFIGLELLVAHARRRPVYRLGDALGDLGCGIGQQVVLVFAEVALLGLYTLVFNRFRVHTFAARSPAPWLISFLFVEAAYYWWHRLSHVVNVLWAAHVVHHQSEDYNLAVALRQAVATSFTVLPFYLPMALLGVPPLVYVAMVSFSTLYQFWIHTELVGRLGFLEWFLNTPSHHRVHHAVNPQYLDRNYGAVLIVWDRLFGSYAEEVEPPVYGVTKPIRSFNPIWAQVQGWVEIFEKARRLPRWQDRLRIWFMPPAWPPAGVETAPAPELRAKYDPRLPAGLELYVFVQFVPAVVATFLMLFWQQSAAPAFLAAGAAFTLWTLASLGGLLDGRSWAPPLELGRVVAVAAALAARAGRAGSVPLVVLALAAGIAMALWLTRVERAPARPGRDRAGALPRA